MSPINNQIQPGDFTLLSPEKQESFEPSEKFKESLEIAQSEVCNYIRTILGENKRFNLNTLAHESGVAIRIVILLSNYAQSYRELEQTLEKNKDFLNHIHQEGDIELVIDIIKNDFESFLLQNIGEIRQKFIDRMEQQEQEKRSSINKRRELEAQKWKKNREKFLSELSQYFGLMSVDILKRYGVDDGYAERVMTSHWFVSLSNSNDFIEFIRERKIQVVADLLGDKQDTLIRDFNRWLDVKYNIDGE